MGIPLMALQYFEAVCIMGSQIAVARTRFECQDHGRHHHHPSRSGVRAASLWRETNIFTAGYTSSAIYHIHRDEGDTWRSPPINWPISVTTSAARLGQAVSRTTQLDIIWDIMNSDLNCTFACSKHKHLLRSPSNSAVIIEKRAVEGILSLLVPTMFMTGLFLPRPVERTYI